MLSFRLLAQPVPHAGSSPERFCLPVLPDSLIRPVALRRRKTKKRMSGCALREPTGTGLISNEDLSLNLVVRRAPCIAALALFGLLGGCHSAPQLRLERTVTSLPETARDRVHLYLVGSPIDPAELGGLPSMERYFHDLGFRNTEKITWTTPSRLADRIANDRQADPASCTVLVGWSLGCYQILEASSQLERKRHIHVDRVICLDGNPWVGLQGRRKHYPTSSENVVCIYPSHRELPEGLARTRQRSVNAAHHFAVPMHEETIETILSELATVTRPAGGSGPESSRVAQRSPPAGLSGQTRLVAESLPARQIVGAAYWQDETVDTPSPPAAKSPHKSP
jgi:hypothetical protein